MQKGELRQIGKEIHRGTQEDVRKELDRKQEYRLKYTEKRGEMGNRWLGSRQPETGADNRNIRAEQKLKGKAGAGRVRTEQKPNSRQGKQGQISPRTQQEM